MTHEELLTKAIEWLRAMEPRLPERFRHLTVDCLPKHRVRDAVVIEFGGDENRGRIQITLDRETGDILGANWPSPMKKSDDNAA
jgi:hypothetical protein